MSGKYGPSRGEHWFRVAAGLVILGGVGLGLAIHGFSGGPAMLEIVGIGGGLGLILVVSSGRKLWRGK